MNVAARWWPLVFFAAFACGTEQATVPRAIAVGVSGPLRGTPYPSSDVQLHETNAADVGGSRVAFDGIDEGLSWPALVKAVTARAGASTPLVIRIERTVPTIDVLRAVWSLRAFDIVVETPDASGKLYAIELPRKKGSGPLAGKVCHAAVFARPDETFRVAAPGGSREIGGERPADTLVASLAAERDRCAFDYVAFGAESNQVAWSTVFDVMEAVDQARAVGDARYVLGEAMR